MAVKHVGTYTAKLETDDGPYTLLWGDTCRMLGDTRGGKEKVRARGKEGMVDAAALTGRSLLELYIIDVGQGDGILLKTPEGAWHLIDGGVRTGAQMTKKGAPNFIRWKFKKDLEQDTVVLANVVVTHGDGDHYGGIVSLLEGDYAEPMPVEVVNLYHNGIGRFAGSPPLGALSEGTVQPFPIGAARLSKKGRFITELLDDKSSFENPPRPFQKGFAEFANSVSSKVGKISRLSRDDSYVPGYGEGENDVVIRVLGPILERLDGGRRGLRWLGSDSVTLNGHSIVLRLDYKRARILLTGDLNKKSQRLLLSYVPETQFLVDVAKACHHGAEDIELDFVKALKARATVISSGDFEDYSHPRPVVMGASARYGREARDDKGDVMPPLIYSTELARSVRLQSAHSVRVDVGDGQNADTVVKARHTEVRPDKARKPRVGAADDGYRSLVGTPISTDLVYGLVNVRTDGEHVLCATLEEQGNTFDVKVFAAGVTT